jgi:hypothetical protein
MTNQGCTENLTCTALPILRGLHSTWGRVAVLHFDSHLVSLKSCLLRYKSTEPPLSLVDGNYMTDTCLDPGSPPVKANLLDIRVNSQS